MGALPPLTPLPSRGAGDGAAAQLRRTVPASGGSAAAPRRWVGALALRRLPPPFVAPPPPGVSWVHLGGQDTCPSACARSTAPSGGILVRRDAVACRRQPRGFSSARAALCSPPWRSRQLQAALRLPPRLPRASLHLGTRSSACTCSEASGAESPAFGDPVPSRVVRRQWLC